MSTEPTDKPDAAPSGAASANPAGLTEVAIDAETEADSAPEAADLSAAQAPDDAPAPEPALSESAAAADEATEDAGDEPAPEQAAADLSAETADGSDAEVSPETEAEAEPEPDPEPDEALIARVRAMFATTPTGDADTDEDATEGDEAETPTPAIRFARWARPIAPRVYGVESQSADTLMASFKRAADAAKAPYAVEDDKYGANVLVFVCSEWLELKATPRLEQLMPQLDHLIGHLRTSDASTHRMIGFDETGAIDFAVVLIRVDDTTGALSGETVALDQAVRIMLDWSESAFESERPLRVTESGRASLKPFIEAVLASAYDEDAPVASDDGALIDTLARGVAKRMSSSSGGNGRGGDARRSNRRRRRGGGNSSGRRKRGGDSGAEA